MCHMFLYSLCFHYLYWSVLAYSSTSQEMWGNVNILIDSSLYLASFHLSACKRFANQLNVFAEANILNLLFNVFSSGGLSDWIFSEF